jgi:hypothetical protein
MTTQAKTSGVIIPVTTANIYHRGVRDVKLLGFFTMATGNLLRNKSRL